MDCGKHHTVLRLCVVFVYARLYDRLEFEGYVRQRCLQL